MILQAIITVIIGMAIIFGLIFAGIWIAIWLIERDVRKKSGNKDWSINGVINQELENYEIQTRLQD